MKTKLKKLRSSKSTSVEKRLAGYGTMSVAVAAALVPNANAAPIIYYPADVTTPVGGALYFNVVNGSTNTEPGSLGIPMPGESPGEFALFNEVGVTLQKAFVFGSSNNKFAVSQSLGGGSNSSAARLTFDTKIGQELNFANFFSSLASNRPASVQAGHWNALGTDYLGLEFEIGSQTDYGWAQITVNSNYTITLDGVAYNNSGGSIGAGETPEPNSLLLMALGAAGLAAYRRKRAAKLQTPVKEG